MKKIIRKNKTSSNGFGWCENGFYNDTYNDTLFGLPAFVSLGTDNLFSIVYKLKRVGTSAIDSSVPFVHFRILKIWAKTRHRFF